MPLEAQRSKGEHCVRLSQYSALRRIAHRIPAEDPTQAAISDPPALTAVCIFLLALACYMLSYSGVPISDDEQLYASAARNLAITGELSAGQMYANARLAGSYHGVEPGFPAVASVWLRLFKPWGAGSLQALYLLPALCSALSAALIVILAGQLGFSASLGGTAALLYAFGSMAWPYAKTLFREPMLCLLLLGSWSTSLFLIRQRHRLPSLLGLMLLIVLLAALILTRVVMAAAAAALFLMLALAHPSLRGRGRVAWLAPAVVLVAAALAVILASPGGTDANIYYRFSGGFLRDALARLSLTPHAHLAEALLAPIFSPWKGLLFYAPACIPGLISLAIHFRGRLELTALPSFVVATLLLMQALAYDAAWWTPTWGSRFLLPAVPLLVVSSLPILEHLQQSGERGRWALRGLLGAGAVIQLPAVLFNSSAHTALTVQQLGAAFPGAVMWSVARSPIVAQWTSAATGEPDLMLWRAAAASPWLVLAVCTLALCLAVLAVLGLLRRWSSAFLPLSILIIVLSFAAVLRAGTYDPSYRSREFEPACAFLARNLSPGEILIVQPYPGPAWQYFMNAECGQRSWYSLPYASQPDAAERARELILRGVQAGGRYWLLQQFWGESPAREAADVVPPGDTLVAEKLIYIPIRMSLRAYAHPGP